MKPIVLFIALLTFSTAYAQTSFDPEKYNPSYSLPTPEKWGIERFPIPIDFALAIPYKGIEDIRFTPGWGDSKSNDYWSYAFLWFLDGSPEITPQATEKNLTAYYTGLIGRNIDKRKIPQEKITPVKVVIKKSNTASGDLQTYAGMIDMLDYMEQKPMTLNVVVHIKKCPGKNNTFVFYQISPQPLTNEVWNGLQALWTNFDCD
ncbi:MAG: hypothetical protein WDO14_21530 [Bacteroidota bacterium]